MFFVNSFIYCYFVVKSFVAHYDRSRSVRLPERSTRSSLGRRVPTPPRCDDPVGRPTESRPPARVKTDGRDTKRGTKSEG